MKKTALLLVLAAIGGYYWLLSRPTLYFSQSVTYKNFTLRSSGDLPVSFEGALDRALEKITAAELYAPDMKFDIYLPGGRREFHFFAPYQHGDYFRVNPLNGAIFIAAADFGADQAFTAPGDPEHRRLSSEIAAAAAQAMIWHKVERLKFMTMEDWLLRGYAQRVSGGAGTFTPADICAANKADDALQDYEYGLAVESAMREGPVSFGELLNSNYSYEGAEKRITKQYCGR